MEVEWDKVVMFHLDEYINLAETHKASFRKYLKERFIQVVNPKKAYLVNGEGNVCLLYTSICSGEAVFLE